jgi:N-acetylneuraminic acid mutarotase
VHRFFLPLVLPLLLIGCKHPLAIEGFGDIVELNGTGRGCTFEEQAAGDSRCTENNVSGDYFVEYHPEPRPGWRFNRWVGTGCSPVSEGNSCLYDVPAGWVSFWDTTYPDFPLQPTTALFELPDSWYEFGQWPEMPSPHAEHTACSVNGKVYVFGGVTAQRDIGGGIAEYSTAVEEYDMSSRTWSSRSPMKEANTLMSAVSLNGLCYLFGGQTRAFGWSGPTTSRVESYDPASDTWQTLSDMPTPRNWVNAVSVAGKIYAIGGATGGPGNGRYGPSTIVEVYDPATDSWSSASSMPTLRGMSAAAAVNDRIYVIGGNRGYRDPSYMTTVEEYEPATDTWRSRASLPTGLGMISAVAHDGKIYVLGGTTGYDGEWTYTGDSFEYDPAIDSWRKVAAGINRHFNGTAVESWGYILVTGGQLDGPEARSSTVLDIYSPP